MIQTNSLLEAFYGSERYSVKLDSYFPIYENLLLKYAGKPVVIVEIGILDGGSLQMWKTFFGNNARIIGIEKNPEALKFEELGFEIFIADQESETELKKVFEAIGPIDILIDDGSHTSKGQIISCLSCIKYIRDGGLVIIEDTHSSFARDFGNNYKYSFANWVSKLSASLDKEYLISRGLTPSKKMKIKSEKTIFFISRILSIEKFRSMTVFTVSDNLKLPTILQNGKNGNGSKDVRWESKRIINQLKILENFTAFQFESIGNTNKKFRYFNFLTGSQSKKYTQLFLKPGNMMISRISRVILHTSQLGLGKYF